MSTLSSTAQLKVNFLVVLNSERKNMKHSFTPPPPLPQRFLSATEISADVLARPDHLCTRVDSLGVM